MIACVVLSTLKSGYIFRRIDDAHFIQDATFADNFGPTKR